MSTLPTISDLLAALDSTGLPVTTLVWPNGKAAPLPYIVAVPTEARNLMADGATYQRSREWDVELYMRELDMGILATVEDALDAAGIPYPSSVIVLDEMNHYALARIVRITLGE